MAHLTALAGTWKVCPPNERCLGVEDVEKVWLRMLLELELPLPEITEE